MLEAIRPLLLLVVMGLAGAAMVAPLMHFDPVDAEAVEAARERAKRDARIASRPSPREMSASRRAELDAFRSETFDRELALAATMSEQGRSEDAARVLERALVLAPRHHGVRARLITALRRAERWAEAEAWSKKLLADDPYAWEAWAARLDARRAQIGAAAFAKELESKTSESRRLLDRALAGHPKTEPTSDLASRLKLLGLPPGP
jgi:tetratricopeptide (TPR) repeat protein